MIIICQFRPASKLTTVVSLKPLLVKTYTSGGYFLFFLIKVCLADSAKNRSLFSEHMKEKKKFSKPMECFMPEAGEISRSDPQGKQIYCLISEMKNSLLRKKNHSPPTPCIEWPAP